MSVDPVLVARIGAVADTPPPPACSSDPMAWVAARVEQMQQAWTTAGFPLTTAGLWVSRDRARQLCVPGFLGDRPRVVVAGVQLVNVSAAGDRMPEDRFMLRPAVQHHWPDLLHSYASTSVHGWFYEEPVTAGELAVRWTLERDGMASEEAKAAAAALA